MLEYLSYLVKAKKYNTTLFNTKGATLGYGSSWYSQEICHDKWIYGSLLQRWEFGKKIVCFNQSLEYLSDYTCRLIQYIPERFSNKHRWTSVLQKTKVPGNKIKFALLYPLYECTQCTWGWG